MRPGRTSGLGMATRMIGPLRYSPLPTGARSVRKRAARKRGTGGRPAASNRQPARHCRELRMASGRFVSAVMIAGLVAIGCGEAVTGTSNPTEPIEASAAAAGQQHVDPVVDRPPADSPDVAALAAGLNQVGYDLFQVAAGQSDADVVLSPLSIGIAFGLADAGAAGPLVRRRPRAAAAGGRTRAVTCADQRLGR